MVDLQADDRPLDDGQFTLVVQPGGAVGEPWVQPALTSLPLFFPYSFTMTLSGDREVRLSRRVGGGRPGRRAAVSAAGCQPPAPTAAGSGHLASRRPAPRSAQAPRPGRSNPRA